MENKYQQLVPVSILLSALVIASTQMPRVVPGCRRYGAALFVYCVRDRILHAPLSLFPPGPFPDLRNHPQGFITLLCIDHRVTGAGFVIISIDFQEMHVQVLTINAPGAICKSFTGHNGHWMTRTPGL
jgi:hypothetical protein